MEQIDLALYKTLNTLPALPFAQLTRPDQKSAVQSRRAWFADRSLPVFTYSRTDKFDVIDYQQKLKVVHDRIASMAVDEPIRQIYFEKINELHHRLAIIIAIKNKDDVAVSAATDHLFGEPAQSINELTDEFNELHNRSHQLHTHQHSIDANLFRRMIELTLNHYDVTNWKIVATKRSSLSVIRSDKNGITIKLPTKFSSSRARAARLLTHEIEVHVLRSFNGRNSPIALLGRGLANYISTDEGLAVYMQQKLKAEESMDPGFWDLWATVLSKELGFVDVFDTIYTARKTLNLNLNLVDAEHEANDTAWRLSLRLNRGIHQPGTIGLGFRRDHIYRTGLSQVRHAVDTYGEEKILPTLFAGHAGIEHLPLLLSMGIEGRVPEMIGKRVVKEVMNENKKSRS